MGTLAKQITIQEASALGYARLVTTSDPRLFDRVGLKMRIVKAGKEYPGEIIFQITDKNTVRVFYNNGMEAEFSKRVDFWGW